MSTFGGLTKEYPQVALDLFSGKDVMKARAYFLSHVHTDHMVGLHSDTFARHMKKHPGYKLYCSEVTREFLLTSQKHCHLGKSLVALPILQPCEVSLPNDVNGADDKLHVTLLPAGHCPGSVMFLLEGSAGRVLYTGDFRLKKGDVAKIEPLHSGDSVKPITSLYIDTTFFDPKIMYIPNREQSCEAMLRLIEEQLQRGPEHMVHIKCKAKYGYEFLFVEIAKAFGTKVHVSDEVMRQYDRVPDLADHMTTEGSTTRVHACRKYSCNVRKATDVITIIPSTMWFNSNAEPDDVLKRISSHTYRLCFSFHSSYSEICDLISYLRPRNIYPNVIPYNATEYEMIERLQEVLRESPSRDEAVQETTTYQPLGQLKLGKRRKRTMGHQREGSQNRSLEMLFEGGSPGFVNSKPSTMVLDSASHGKNDQAMEDIGEQRRTSIVEQEEEGEEGGNSDTLFSDESESDLDEESFRTCDSDDEKVPPGQGISDLECEQERVTEADSSQDSSSLDGSPLKSFCRYIPKSRDVVGVDITADSDEGRRGGRIEQKSQPSCLPEDSASGNLVKYLPKVEQREADGLAENHFSHGVKVSRTSRREQPKGSILSAKSTHLNSIEDRSKGEEGSRECTARTLPQEPKGNNGENDGAYSQDSQESGSPIKGLVAYLPKRTKFGGIDNRGHREPSVQRMNGMSSQKHGNNRGGSERNSKISLARSSPKKQSRGLDSWDNSRSKDVGMSKETGNKIVGLVPSESSPSDELPVKSFFAYLPRRGEKMLPDDKMRESDTRRLVDGERGFVDRMPVEEENIGVHRYDPRNVCTSKEMILKKVPSNLCEKETVIQENLGSKDKRDGVGKKPALKGSRSSRPMHVNGKDSVRVPRALNGEVRIEREVKSTPDNNIEPCNRPNSSETGLSSDEPLIIDLTVGEEEEESSTADDRDVIICSQDTVKSSPSVRSSQETYLSPSKLFTNNSQDPFPVSSPESSDATPDLIELT